LRNTRFADSGIVQFNPARTPQVAEDERHNQHAREPERDPAEPRNRDADHAKQQAERHPQADRDVTELCRPFDRVAEEPAERREVGAIGQDPDAIAVFEDDVGPGLQVAVAAHHVRDDGWLLTG
jgi:hypothetical protein